jgi:hypothetical protein
VGDALAGVLGQFAALVECAPPQSRWTVVRAVAVLVDAEHSRVMHVRGSCGCSHSSRVRTMAPSRSCRARTPGSGAREIIERALGAALAHARAGREGTERFVEKVNGEVAPAVAAGIDAVMDEALWRLADVEFVVLMGSEDPRVRIEGLKIVDEAFRIMERS